MPTAKIQLYYEPFLFRFGTPEITLHGWIISERAQERLDGSDVAGLWYPEWFEHVHWQPDTSPLADYTPDLTAAFFAEGIDASAQYPNGCNVVIDPDSSGPFYYQFQNEHGIGGLIVPVELTYPDEWDDGVRPFFLVYAWCFVYYAEENRTEIYLVQGQNTKPVLEHAASLVETPPTGFVDGGVVTRDYEEITILPTDRSGAPTYAGSVLDTNAVRAPLPSYLTFGGTPYYTPAPMVTKFEWDWGDGTDKGYVPATLQPGTVRGLPTESISHTYTYHTISDSYGTVRIMDNYGRRSMKRYIGYPTLNYVSATHTPHGEMFTAVPGTDGVQIHRFAGGTSTREELALIPNKRRPTLFFAGHGSSQMQICVQDKVTGNWGLMKSDDCGASFE